MKVYKVTLVEDVEPPFSYFARKRDAKRFELAHDEIDSFDEIEVRTPYELAEILEKLDAKGHRAQTTLDHIHKLLDGTCWSADTLDAVASCLRNVGLKVREVA